MALHLLSFLRWAVPVVLNWSLFGLALRRGLHRHLPFFSLYVGTNAFYGLYALFIERKVGFHSLTTFYMLWIAQGIVMVARGFAVVEVCNRFLRAYRGIWGLAWRLLAVVGAGLIAYAAFAAAKQAYWLGGLIVAADRGLELSSAVTLVVLFGITTYYRIDVAGTERRVAFGFTFFSLAAVFADSLVLLWLKQAFAYSLIQEVAYMFVLVLWLKAIWNPLPAEARPPSLLMPGVYDEIVPQVNERLRAVNDRLMDLLRSKPKEH